MLRALEKEGITVVDGQQAILDARQIKSPDEIELIKQSTSLADAVHDVCARQSALVLKRAILWLWLVLHSINSEQIGYPIYKLLRDLVPNLIPTIHRIELSSLGTWCSMMP